MKQKILEYLNFHMIQSRLDAPGEGTCKYNLSFLTMMEDINEYFTEASAQLNQLRNEILHSTSNYTPNEVLDMLDFCTDLLQGSQMAQPSTLKDR